MSPAIITLTTDFGIGSPYVAELKGAIFSVTPQVTIVDLTHNVPPQDILAGALVLGPSTLAFPKKTIHVAVVDPGVGSQRALLLAHINGVYYIAPDNGLLTLLLADQRDVDVRQIDRPEFWRQPVSRTFHGRDIMGPVAAHLALGRAPSELASPLERPPVALSIPQPMVAKEQIDGEVVAIDSFGNLLTNVHQRHIENATHKPRVQIGGRELSIAETYSDHSPGEVLSLIGSSGWLEIAVNLGNAAELLDAGRGEPVRVAW